MCVCKCPKSLSDKHQTCTIIHKLFKKNKKIYPKISANTGRIWTALVLKLIKIIKCLYGNQV